MDKWQYKFSFFSGILFIFSFLSKEFIKSSENVSLVIGSYILMIVYNTGLFLGFIKYSKLNKKIPLFFSTVLVIISYGLSVVLEMVGNMVPISANSLIYFISIHFLALSYIVFAICMFLRKKMYGKSTMLAAAFCFLFGFSFLIQFSDIVGIFRLPIFLLAYILLTYVVKKNKKKMEKKSFNQGFLKDRFN